jgi:hypothetical protein
VKLPEDSHIAPEKLTRYLLVPQARRQVGVSGFNRLYVGQRHHLLTDLRAQILNQDATALEKTTYGQLYEIRAQLVGPSGRALRVRTIWMTEYLSGATKFITLIPD